ncbi:MAG: O-antigen ligase family protein [Bacteroidetes bacterium]|nr:O-antigen ligase family protein [Bacteroidota bacterium]MBS1929775.1 O-antigen ligase family protein [Bacteroidota bacterium]
MWNKLQNERESAGSYQNQWRPAIIFTLLVFMLASVFFSRMLLSVSMIVFISFSFTHLKIKTQISSFVRSPLLWSMSLLFFVPLLSGLWSANQKEWLDIIKIKAPLFLMPLAFAAPFGFSKKQWPLLAWIFIVFVTGATLWSMGHYILDFKQINENYLRSQLLVTPLENDHVRFSWMLAVSVLVTVWLWLEKKNESNRNNRLLLILLVWQIIFLHILAARTGLICFYAMAFIAGFGFILRKRKIKQAIPFLFLLIILPVIAYLVIPTFQNRVKYFLYDLPYFSKGHYSPSMNDAVRVISLKAGWGVLNEHPFSGVGFGDLSDETKNWYAAYQPQMQEADKILPSSEWLIYGDGFGWPGMILLGVVMFIPFFIRLKKDRLLWILLNTSVLFSILFDISLEIQFGVFLYSFTVLWWWKQDVE